MDSPMAQGRALRAITIAVGAAAIALPVLVVANPPVIPPPVRIARPSTRVVPQAEIPVVEPLALVDVAPDDARAFNATVPFSTDPNPAARPFRIGGDPASQQRATACLAAAVLYEAGDDAVGERAVAQVVLNRLRHPAFPKTVCGVVFEGSDRRTGCQFTFTCDGALARRPSEAAWTRAERIAAAALAGSVYAPVGQSTHYHTDWVVPYWQSSLDKVAAVHTHLFFRWTGWWGTPPAFNRTPSTVEPAEPQLAAWSDAHRMGAAMAEAGDTLDAAATLIEPTPPAPIAGDVSSFLVTLPRGAVHDVDRGGEVTAALGLRRVAYAHVVRGPGLANLGAHGCRLGAQAAGRQAGRQAGRLAGWLAAAGAGHRCAAQHLSHGRQRQFHAALFVLYA